MIPDPDLFRQYDDDYFWGSRVAESGNSAVSVMMERPPGADYPLGGVETRTKVGSLEPRESTPPGGRSVRFETELEAGSTELWTWLDRADGASRGAYFVHVERCACDRA